jgi:hypothetical protein
VENNLKNQVAHRNWLLSMRPGRRSSVKYHDILKIKSAIVAAVGAKYFEED